MKAFPAIIALACGLLLIGSPRIANAQAPDSVIEIEFRNNTRNPVAVLESAIRTQVGQPFNQATVDQDIARLMRTGRFLAVTADVVNAARGRKVVFVLNERPTIVNIVFDGNGDLSDPVLIEQVPVAVGDQYDAFAIREGVENIRDLYLERGYAYVSVEVDFDSVRASGNLIYEVEEGPRVRIRKILFEGRESVVRRELTKRIRSNTALWIIRTGVFDESVVEGDVASIRKYYRDLGFLDARVSYRVDTTDRAGDLHLVFVISEGARYRIESIAFDGCTFFSTDELRGKIESAEQEYFKQPDIDRDANAVQSALGENGFIDARVEPTRVFSTEPGYVRVTFNVSEGEQVRVGRIVVRGNSSTQDRVIRRVLELYPGQLYNTTNAQTAQRRLVESQIFDRVSITPVGQAPGVRDIIVDVTESEKRADFIFGFGITSDNGLVGNILFQTNNFDIFDTPRNFEEFIKGQAFRGAGQRLRLELQPGTELNRFRLDFTENYLFDRPLRFDFSLFHFTRGREDYREQRTGSIVSFGKRLTEGLTYFELFKDWYGEVAFRVEHVQLKDADLFDAEEIRDSAGDTILTSVKGTVIRDRTDSRLLPSEGDRTSLSFEQFVGDANFGKLRVGYTRHQTVRIDEQNRKSVFSFNIDAGYIFGEAPVYERFYAGGIGSLRGFDFRGIGPRGGIRNDVIGGDFKLTANIEYTFPLMGDVLRGVLFTDMGTVEESLTIQDWRVSVGIGVRFTIELFGPLPIEVDFGFPVVRGEDDEERVVSFFIGSVF